MVDKDGWVESNVEDYIEPVLNTSSLSEVTGDNYDSKSGPEWENQADYEDWLYSTERTLKQTPEFKESIGERIRNKEPG